jgi:hypothetical protein
LIKQPAYKNNYLATGLFLVMGILCIAFTLHAPIADFGNYYYGSKLFIDGKFSLTDYQHIHHFNQQIASYGATGYFENYSPVPPFSLVFYIPFTVLSCLQAKLLFNIISLALFCLSLFRLLHHLKINSLHSYLLPVIFLYPLYSNTYQGQTFLLITAFLMESYLADEHKKPFLSAFFLALSISLKLFPVFILCYYLFKKSYKTTLYSVLLLTGFQLLTLCFVGRPITSYYFIHALPRLLNNDIIGAYYFSNESVYTLLLNLFSYEELQNPHPLLNAPWLVPVIESSFVAIILSVLYALRNRENNLFFGITVFFCLIAGRYNATYGMLMLVPFVVSFLADKKKNIYHYFLLFVLCIAISMPVGRFIHSALFLQYSRLIGLLFVFGLLIVLYRPKIHIAILAIFLCMVTLFRNLNYTYSKPAYFEVQNSKGLLYDYSIKNDSIAFVSTLGDHELKERFAIKHKAIRSELLYIKDHCLYYKGTMIDNAADNKQKPFIYNDSLAVFMSDMNQGLGFYKLRTVPLK